MFDLVPVTGSGPRKGSTAGDVSKMVLGTLTPDAWPYTVAVVSDGCKVNAKAWREVLSSVFPYAFWVSCIGHKLAKVSKEVESKLPNLEALLKYSRTYIRYNKRKWSEFLRHTSGRKGSFGLPTSHGWEDPFEQALFWQSRLDDFLPLLNDGEVDELDSEELPAVPVPPAPASAPANYRISASLLGNARPPASAPGKKTPPARKGYRIRFHELVTVSMGTLRTEVDMVAAEYDSFCKFIRAFQVQGRAFDMYENYCHTTSWLSRLPDKYPAFAAFWSKLYDEWKGYEFREDLVEMFTFFRNVRVLDPRQTATIAPDRDWPKDPNIRSLLWAWYDKEGATCRRSLAGQSAEAYWSQLRGYGNLPEWVLVAIQCPMSSADAERAFNFMHYVQQEHAPHMTAQTLKTRCMLAYNSRKEYYVPVRWAKRSREDDPPPTVADGVLLEPSASAPTELGDSVSEVLQVDEDDD